MVVSLSGGETSDLPFGLPFRLKDIICSGVLIYFGGHIPQGIQFLSPRYFSCQRDRPRAALVALATQMNSPGVAANAGVRLFWSLI